MNSPNKTSPSTPNVEMSMVQHQMPRSPQSGHSRSPSTLMQSPHPQFNPSLSTYVQTQESYQTQHNSSRAHITTSPMRSPRGQPDPAPRPASSRSSHHNHHHQHHKKPQASPQKSESKKSQPQQVSSPTQEVPKNKPAQDTTHKPKGAAKYQTSPNRTTTNDEGLWCFICCRSTDPYGTSWCCCCCCDNGSGHGHRGIGHHHYHQQQTTCCQGGCCENGCCADGCCENGHCEHGCCEQGGCCYLDGCCENGCCEAACGDGCCDGNCCTDLCGKDCCCDGLDTCCDCNNCDCGDCDCNPDCDIDCGDCCGKCDLFDCLKGGADFR